ncbi:protein of unknown function [Xenorhabdus poinarii G6]|uniref:Uncharacterized protein n=1 Tax=Xenorhabdus poinarii G6 TaxID=1354304 RepID=A0A068R6X3_9GAMM|nr:protein of unknown function [Xenorhabdus poinarii G6]
MLLTILLIDNHDDVIKLLEERVPLSVSNIIYTFETLSERLKRFTESLFGMLS